MRRVVAIVQARMRSTRLPGKALADLAGRPLLVRVVERAQMILGVDEVVVATSTEAEDRAILECARASGIRGITGSETDVLDRYVKAARATATDVVVRLTADCPLLDPEVSALVVGRFGSDVDYVSNTNPPTYPDGLDTEAFSIAALERAWREAALPSEREHVTPYIWKHPDRFRVANVRCDRDLSGLRWTVDEPDDLVFVRAVYERLDPRPKTPFTMRDVLELLEREPGLATVNGRFARNEGYARSLGRDHPAAKRKRSGA